MSPHQYIMSVQVEDARDLLRQSRLEVEKIAELFQPGPARLASPEHTGRNWENSISMRKTRLLKLACSLSARAGSRCRGWGVPAALGVRLANW